HRSLNRLRRRRGIKSRLMSELRPPEETSTKPSSNDPGSANPSANPAGKGDAMFSTRQAEGGGIPPMAWGVAGLAVLVIVAILVLAGRHKTSPPNTLQTPTPYAASLPLSQIAMSESTSLSGGKSTYIDGHIRNTGNQT